MARAEEIEWAVNVKMAYTLARQPPPFLCHLERAGERSLMRWTVSRGGRSFTAVQDDKTNRWLPIGQSDVDSPLSTVTSMKCQVGSLPAPCHPEAAAEGSLLRSTVSSQGRFLAAARNDNERWRLSHHSTGHIMLVGALRMTKERVSFRHSRFATLTLTTH